MAFFDLVIKLLAIWGALLSTYLCITKLLENRKKIKIYIDRVYFRAITQITIINTGKRKFTIADINANIGHKEKNGGTFWEGVPKNAIFGEAGEAFPVTIDPDDYYQRQIGRALENYISDKDTKVNIEVIDITGKKFTKYSKRSHDVKWGNINDGGW